MSSFTSIESATRVARVQAGSRGGSRVVERRAGFDLNSAGNTLVVDLPRCVAASVAVTLQAGSFGAATLSLKQIAPGKLIPFGSAKDITAEGILTLSEDECLGLTQVALVVNVAAGTLGLAIVQVSVEEAA